MRGSLAYTQATRDALASFNEDIGAWDTSGVTIILHVHASAFNQDIGAWDTSDVTSMKNMFTWASSFNQDISDWAVESVTDMESIFFGASAFDQNLGWCVGDDLDLGTACSFGSLVAVVRRHSKQHLRPRTDAAPHAPAAAGPSPAPTPRPTRQWSFAGADAGVPTCSDNPTLRRRRRPRRRHLKLWSRSPRR